MIRTTSGSGISKYLILLLQRSDRRVGELHEKWLQRSGDFARWQGNRDTPNYRSARLRGSAAVLLTENSPEDYYLTWPELITSKCFPDVRRSRDQDGAYSTCDGLSWRGLVMATRFTSSSAQSRTDKEECVNVQWDINARELAPTPAPLCQSPPLAGATPLRSATLDPG